MTGEPGPHDADGVAENRWDDCLPASIAAALLWLQGDYWTPDGLKDAAYGDGFIGYTEPGRFVSLLAGLGVTGTPIRNDDPLPTVRYALTVQQPVLARTFEPEGYFHWTPIIGLDADKVTRHQVLGGGEETVGRRTWLNRYAGYLFVLAEE